MRLLIAIRDFLRGYGDADIAGLLEQLKINDERRANGLKPFSPAPVTRRQLRALHGIRI